MNQIVTQICLYRWKFLLEFVVIIVPALLSITVFADALPSLFGFQLAIILVVVATNVMLIPSARSKDGAPRLDLTHAVRKTLSFQYREKELYFVTEYRSCMLLMTAMCILAVDFNIFPRRFAKTEVYGYSLMDCGVGSFILSNALVAPEARSKQFSGCVYVSFVLTPLLEEFG